MHTATIDPPFVPRKSSRRDPWTEAEARAVLAAAHASGLSIAAFARRHGMSDRQLYWWHMRLGMLADEHVQTPSAFVPLAIAPSGGGSGVDVLVGGAVLRLQRDFCDQTLARAVAVLRQLPC